MSTGRPINNKKAKAEECHDGAGAFRHAGAGAFQHGRDDTSGHGGAADVHLIVGLGWRVVITGLRWPFWMCQNLGLLNYLNKSMHGMWAFANLISPILNHSCGF
jgi:hypothetical protein